MFTDFTKIKQNKLYFYIICLFLMLYMLIYKAVN